MTGIATSTIRGRRRALGIPPPKRPEPAWVRRAAKLLGRTRDSEVARRVGVSPGRVSMLRRRRGIPRHVPGPAVRLTAAQIERALRTLTGPDRVVFEGRFVARPPRSLADIGRDLGVSKQAVADRERRIRVLLA